VIRISATQLLRYREPQPPIQNPNGQPGVAQLFSNQNDTRHIGDTILILPDADQAVSELDQEKAAVGNMVTGGTPAPAAMSTGGTMVSGTSPDGSKAVTVLLFTEGKAFTNLEFDSAPNDPVPPQFVTDVGQKQDTAIKTDYTANHYRPLPGHVSVCMARRYA
jgi:hypothetical protein